MKYIAYFTNKITNERSYLGVFSTDAKRQTWILKRQKINGLTNSTHTLTQIEVEENDETWLNFKAVSE